MKRFLHCYNGYIEQSEWKADSWINIEEPDDDDLKFLSGELGIPESFLESPADIDERPRVDSEAGWLLTILRVPMPGQSADAPYVTVPIGIMTGRDVVVTLCYHKTEMIDDFIEYTRRRSIVVEHRQDFILRLLFSSTYWFLAYLKDINDKVSAAEKELRRSVQNRDLLNMMHMQKTLVYFSTAITGNESLIERLGKVYGDDYDADLLDDLEIELRQADNTVSVYSSILAGTMDSYASIISNNVNQIMKRMTSITIILMVPTLVASFYGMNVSNLLLAGMPGSFFIIVGISVALTAVAYLWLRRIRWF